MIQQNTNQQPQPDTQPVERRKQPKIGVDEFFSIAERFGFTKDAMARLRSTLSNDDLQGDGPNLAKYATSFPLPTKAREFEDEARQQFDSPFALGVSSGTAALHSAMVAVGVQPGKQVIVPAIGFYATAAAVALAGGTPVFCDVDDSLQMDPASLESLINPDTVAITPTHFMGRVCDMEPILAVARRHGLRVIEDCAQSPGAEYRGRRVGTWGDIGCFSISCYKIIGGGEGGLVLASDPKLFDRINQFAEGGGLWRGKERFSPQRYEGELFLGTNYRMSELEAAVDLVQLRKLPELVTRCRRVASRLIEQIKLPAAFTWQDSNAPQGDINYQLRIIPRDDADGETLLNALREQGVSAGRRNRTRPDWHVYSEMLPILAHGAHRSDIGECPVADRLFDQTISLSVDSWWSDAECDDVAQKINRALASHDFAAPLLAR